MGICQGILTAATDAAEREGAARINSIDVTIGELTQVVEDALQFAFEVLRQDTIAADATLTVTFLEPRSRCTECDIEFAHGRFDVHCPECGSYVCDLVQGKELAIESIDID
ncbi:MAG: hydrogenase maturation nickel metallochaperone HypA [Anaerosomatales bacterium]|nr:hydrogenase maturation nickel metallochaperone HypA [Anaerosomatales bacterium]